MPVAAWMRELRDVGYGSEFVARSLNVCLQFGSDEGEGKQTVRF